MVMRLLYLFYFQIEGMCGQQISETSVSTGEDAFQLGNEDEVAEVIYQIIYNLEFIFC